jgi:tripartite-type tricarboxylate transporter receptor subunit TctC
MNRISKGLAALVVAIAAGTASAQAYPEHPITFVVPFAAGGATDTLARQFAERMSRGKAQPIIVENVPGAGGTVGAAKVAKARPDGYTFLVGHVGYMAAATGLYKQLPYDPVQDFDAVARFPDTPLVLVCGRAKPYTANIKALVDFAHQNPGKVNMANAGVGSSGHLVAALVASQLKMNVMHVPYKGNAQALADILGGQVDCLFDQSNTALPQVRGGKVVGVVTTARQRLPQMPDVPTLDESGLPGFEAATWYGIYAPKGTPREAIQWIAMQFAEAMNDAAFTGKLVETGYVLLPAEQQKGAALAAHTRKEVELWKKVIVDANIPPQ